MFYSCLFGFGRFRVRRGPHLTLPFGVCVCVILVFFFFCFGYFRCFCCFFVVFCLCCCWSVFGVFICLLFGVVFYCFVCVGVFFVVFVFLVVFGGLLLFCSLCLLEWSRCCSCFVFLVCFVCVFLCLFFVCLCLFLSASYEITVFPAILVFSGLMLVECWFNVGSMLVSHFWFWFLLFVFALFAFSRWSFVVSACWLVLFRNTWLDFLIICILFSCFLFDCSLEICIFWFLATYQKTSLQNLEISKTPKWVVHKKRTTQNKVNFYTVVIYYALAPS